jgi:DNA polymerase-3 subunit chi
MTKIDFFTNVADKTQQLAGLSAKALPKGRKLFVFVPDENEAVALSAGLWSAKATGFLPNCLANATEVVQTPIVLGWDADALPHDDILVNYQSDHPPFFSRFHRLIELVGLEEADVKAARVRFKFYRDRGYEISIHDTAVAED